MYRRFSGIVLLLLYLLVPQSQAQAQQNDTLYLRPTDKPLPLDSFARYQPDSLGKLRIEDLLKPETKRAFVQLRSDTLLSSSVYWGKLIIKNTSKESGNWRLQLVAELTEVYVMEEDGSFERKLMGALRPGSELDIPQEWFHAGLSFAPGETKEVYFRLENLSDTPLTPTGNLQPEAMRQQKLYEVLSNRNLIQGIFQGMIWIMIIYNALVFFSVRDRAFLFYALYLASASLYFLSRYRFLSETIFYDHPQWSLYGWALGIGAISICYHLFLRAFFDTKRRLPRLDHFILIWVYVKIALTVVVMSWLLMSWNLRTIVQLSIIPLFAEISISLYILVEITRKLRKTDIKSLRFFLIGTGFLLLGLLIYGLFLLGFRLDIFKWSFDMLLLLQGSILLEIICFSLGLGYKMQQDRSERLQAQADLILQLKKNEKLQKMAQRNLERKVKERTAEIQQKNEQLGRRNQEIMAQRDTLEEQKEQIEAQNQKLVELNEEKNHLIGIVAHDLRNPLSSILTVADLMKSERDKLSEEDQLECVEHIHEALNRMNQMITRILDVRAIEDQHLQLYPEKLEVAEVLREVLAEFSERARQKGIQMQADLSEEAFATLDRAYTLQIFENLVSNALKFSPPQTEVCLCLKRQGDKVRAEVRDQGPGIAPEEQPKLFQKYQKLSARPTNGETSTGLGLSIVKKYVEAMEGSVWCESEPGKGAKFIVEFWAVR